MDQAFTPRSIKNIRKGLGMSADAFAAELGMTGKHRARNVFNWESGLTKPSRLRFAKLEELGLAADAARGHGQE